jgi:hypothetical protein
MRGYPDAEPSPQRLSDVGEFIRRNPERPFRFMRKWPIGDAGKVRIYDRSAD